MEDNLKSPDMVKFADVLNVITIYGKSFKSEKDLADFIRAMNDIKKYDLHPVADNITNNNTTVNLIAESPKVKQLIEKIKENI